MLVRDSTTSGRSLLRSAARGDSDQRYHCGSTDVIPRVTTVGDQESYFCSRRDTGADSENGPIDDVVNVHGQPQYHIDIVSGPTKTLIRLRDRHLTE